MKTIQLTDQHPELQALLEQAVAEALILQMPDGRVFVLAQIDEFDDEIERTQQNVALMAVLDQRGQAQGGVKLSDVKTLLDLA